METMFLGIVVFLFLLAIFIQNHYRHRRPWYLYWRHTEQWYDGHRTSRYLPP